MKSGRYGKGRKAVMIFLEILFTTLCAVCIGVVSCNAIISVPNRKNTLNLNYYISPFSRTAAFEDSDVFNDMVYDNLDDIIRYGVIRSQLETDGVFDKTKQIDIEQYARHFEEIPVTETSVCYRLGDLIQWGQSGDGISVEEYPYTEAERMIQDAHGRSEAVQKAEESEPVEVAEDGIHERYVLIPIERYRPSDGKSILAHVNSVDELETFVDYLDDTVTMLCENYTSYKEYQAYYDTAPSNFKYCIREEVDGREAVYSNTELQRKSLQEIETYFTGMGRYLCFSPAKFTYQSNTSIREAQMRSIWSNYRYAYSDNTAIWIGIDTHYPYADAFLSAKERYNLAAPGYLYILLSVFCAVLSLLVLGVITGQAGRRKGVDGVFLLWFDHLYTELAAFLGILAATGIFVITQIAVAELISGAAENWEILTALALGTALLTSVLLFFYMSLVRRIKAGTLWKDFLIYRIFLKFQNIFIGIYNDSRNVVRVWVPYLLFVGINGFLISSHFNMAAVVFDILAGIFIYRNKRVQRRILDGIENIKGGNLDYQIDTAKMYGDNRILAEAVNSIGNGIRQAVETSTRDERLKADLITNVSHDIKTPLTSIINYVDLIKREPVENERIQKYLTVLENKSQRLKQLTEDLVEASKISSGNIELQCTKLDLKELMHQAIGEFTERFEERGLNLIVSMEESPVLIYADARRIWRVVENLFQNVCKYALENTRVYVELKRIKEGEVEKARLSIKNISAMPIGVSTQELTERFIRGDKARTTEGSGLGLSIAKNLTELQKGRFEILSDGDLFKAVITFLIVL